MSACEGPRSLSQYPTGSRIAKPMAKMNLIVVISYLMNLGLQWLAIPSQNSPLSTSPSHQPTKPRLPRKVHFARCIQ